MAAVEARGRFPIVVAVFASSFEAKSDQSSLTAVEPHGWPWGTAVLGIHRSCLWFAGDLAFAPPWKPGDGPSGFVVGFGCASAPGDLYKTRVPIGWLLLGFGPRKTLIS